MKSLKAVVWFFCGLISLDSLRAGSEHHEHRHHGKHVHGEGMLNILLEANQAHLEFISPVADVLGADSDKMRKEKLAALEKEMKQIDFWFSPESVKTCKLDQLKLSTKELENGVCTDVNISFRIQCSKPFQTYQPELQLFKRFSSLKEIESQIAGDKIQKAQKLAPSSSSIQF